MRDARIGFPSENPLKLARVSLRGGIPLHADSHIFVDAPARSSSVIDEGDNGLLGFFRRQVTAHQSLQRRRFCLYGIFPPASSAAKRAAIFTLRLGNYFGKCSATTCTYSASMVKVNGLSNIRPIASLVLFDLEAQESGFDHGRVDEDRTGAWIFGRGQAFRGLDRGYAKTRPRA